MPTPVGRSTRAKVSLRKRISLGISDIHLIQTWLLLRASGWWRGKGSGYLSFTPRTTCFSPCGPLIAFPRAGLLVCFLDPGHPVWPEENGLGSLLLGPRDLPMSVMSPPSLRGSLRNGGVPRRELKMLQRQPQDQPLPGQKLKSSLDRPFLSHQLASFP